MNTSPDHNHEDLRYAEYVLGVLDADARTAVERETATDPRAAEEVAWWQQHLAPLCEDVAPVAPPEYVWARIQDALGIASAPAPAAGPAPSRHGLWDSLALWRGGAMVAGAIAVICLVLLAVVPRQYGASPAVPAVAYMASTITQKGGRVGWTATVDLRHARMIVVPAKPQSIAPGHAPELWLIPAGHKPIAVGMIEANAPTTLKLDPALVAQLGPTAALAVSVEPPGGSPTGQPTGPVIGEGHISAAAQGGTRPVALLEWHGDVDDTV